MQAFQISPGPLYKPQKPQRIPAYLRFIKSFACLVCNRTWNIDPCHTGPKGLSQKSCDLSCIPLCRKCHDEFDAAPQEFARKHGLNIPKLIKQFNKLWKQKQRRRA
jgi:hypothetical protein